MKGISIFWRSNADVIACLGRSRKINNQNSDLSILYIGLVRLRHKRVLPLTFSAGLWGHQTAGVRPMSLGLAARSLSWRLATVAVAFVNLNPADRPRYHGKKERDHGGVPTGPYQQSQVKELHIRENLRYLRAPNEMCNDIRSTDDWQACIAAIEWTFLESDTTSQCWHRSWNILCSTSDDCNSLTELANCGGHCKIAWCKLYTTRS